MEILAYPSGAVKLTDQFYIERKADADLFSELRIPGITVTIRGPRQIGKTSLLIRGIQEAVRIRKATVVYIDLQGLEANLLVSKDTFFREIAERIVDALDMDSGSVEKFWRGPRPESIKLTNFISGQVLTKTEHPLVLAMDEVDRLIQTGFHTEVFGLLRSWHNLRASQPDPWEKIDILMAVSTEPYLLINDTSQSPFNVGLVLYLEDFNAQQVSVLNERYGFPLNEVELPKLLTHLGGHPYLTRVALYTIVKDGLSWSDFINISATSRSPFRDHLQYQFRLVSDDRNIKEAFKLILANGEAPDEEARYRLLKAGLVKGSGNHLECRCELYQHYFANKL